MELHTLCTNTSQNVQRIFSLLLPSSSLLHIHTLPSRWGLCSASTILAFILASFFTLFALGYWVTDVGGKQITNSCCNQHEWRKQPLSCCIQYYSDSDTLWPAFWCMYFCWLIYEVLVNNSSFLFHIHYLFSCASTFNAMGSSNQSNIGKTVRLREPCKSEEAHQIKQTVGSLFKITLPPWNLS